MIIGTTEFKHVWAIHNDGRRSYWGLVLAEAADKMVASTPPWGRWTT